MIKEVPVVKSLAFFLILFFSIEVNAQVPQQLNYQAIARKSDGSPITFQDISVRISIIDSTLSGFPADRVVYIETRKVKTNFAGLFNIIIGGPHALSVSGAFGNINWITGKKYLRTEIDPAGFNNFLQLGITELQSVPYALFALNSASSILTGPASGDLTGTYPAPFIANKAITTEKLADSAITMQKLSRSMQNTLSNTVSGNELSNTLKEYVKTGNLPSPGVSSVSIAPLNGITGIVSNPTSTPSISLALGDITPNSVTANAAVTAPTLGGVLTTPNQPFITAIGQLSSLAVSGVFSANSGNFSTATITSLGGLNNLSVTGTIQANSLAGILTTPAQTNITSVGQLTSLLVTGTIAGNIISATTANIANLSGLNNLTVPGTVQANSLAGTLTTSAQPAITSVGQLTNLSVSGTIEGGAFSGSLSNSTQTSITALGQVNNLSVSGTVQASTVSATTVKLTSLDGLTNLTVTGTVNAANFSGTLSTAAQQNITSLGQLSNLSVSGTIQGGNFSGTGFTVVSSLATRYFATMNNVAAASSLTIDLSRGNVIAIPLTTSTVLSFSNPGTNPASYVIKLSYTSSTAFAITWPASVKWSSGTTPTLTCASGKTDIISLIYDGTDYYGTYALNF